MTSEQALLACPFFQCGGEALLVFDRANGGGAYVECQTCETRTRTIQDDNSDDENARLARQLWNSRSALSTPPTEEEAERLLKHLRSMPMTEWVWADAERIFAALSTIRKAEPQSDARKRMEQVLGTSSFFRSDAEVEAPNAVREAVLAERFAQDWRDIGAQVADAHLIVDEINALPTLLSALSSEEKQ